MPIGLGYCPVADLGSYCCARLEAIVTVATRQAEPVLTVKCPRCGQVNRLSAARCTNCAKKLGPNPVRKLLGALVMILALVVVCVCVRLVMSKWHAAHPGGAASPSSREKSGLRETRDLGSSKEPTNAKEGAGDFVRVQVIDVELGDGDIAIMAGSDKGLGIGTRLVIVSEGRHNGTLVLKSVMEEVSWGTIDGAVAPVKQGDIVLIPQ